MIDLEFPYIKLNVAISTTIDEIAFLPKQNAATTWHLPDVPLPAAGNETAQYSSQPRMELVVI